MNPQKEMLLIDNEIVTTKISYCKYDNNNYTYIIKYKNSNKIYNYQTSRVKHLIYSEKIELSNYNFYINNNILNNIKEAYEFSYGNSYYYYIIFNNNEMAEYKDTQIKKVALNKNIIEYMKKVAEITSLNTEDGKKILCEQMEKVEVDNLETSLAAYLKLSNNIIKPDTKDFLIFPFGCNSSQYKAVENAINNKISVIEGPPGTGKTQTILNIIANIIIRNMNCQVVSNNNTAIENIDKKLKKYNLDFIEALLGKSENKTIFIENQKTDIPSFKECKNMNLEELSTIIKNKNNIVKQIYKSKQNLAVLVQNKNELTLEYNYFKEYLKKQNIKTIELKRINKNKLNILWNKLSEVNKITLLDKLKYILIYRIGTFNFYNNKLEEITNTIQEQIYKQKIKTLEDTINQEKSFLERHKEIEEEFITTSMNYLKKYLSERYQEQRKIYSKQEIRQDSRNFIKDYPVILSTTYSSRNTFKKDFKFDYIIMDESSQIDVVTGLLALSSAKYATVIGDEKQLPNVIPDKIKEETNKIFSKYNLDIGYNYSINSFLSSIKSIIPNSPKVILKEHYRCWIYVKFLDTKFHDFFYFL